MAHHKRKAPRIKSDSPAAFPNGCNSAWNIMFHTRPKRARNKAACKKLLKGNDFDNMAFDLGNRKPHKYYW